MTEHRVVPPGEGYLLTACGNVMAFKAVAEQTGRDLSLMERTVPRGARWPPAHRHVNCSEGFFVLDGLIGFEIDGSELCGRPGDFVLAPRGGAHTFGNAGDEPTRLLVLHATGPISTWHPPMDHAQCSVVHTLTCTTQR